MPWRPVAQQVWSGSTSTGSSTAFFGLGFRYLSVFITNNTTKAFATKTQVSAGYSTAWITVLANSTSTGPNLVRTSTGGVAFDRARFVVTANDTTGNAVAWMAVAY